MNQHLHLITLGVRDLDRAKKFYSGTLGWEPAGSSSDDITFYQAGGVILSLFPREKLAEDAQVEPGGQGFAGFTLAYNARSEAEVDEIIRDLRSRGVTILKEPAKAPWGGYSSYFADPDENCWEVAYNPFIAFDDRGNLRTG